MRIIKLGIINIIVFAFLITGFSLFFPSNIRISKAIDINASKDTVLLQISNVENWKHWFPDADSAELIVEDGKMKGISTINRQQLIIHEITDSTVRAVTKTPSLKDGESGWNFIRNYEPNTITVQWYMDFHLHWYPWEKFSSLLLEKRYGPLMEIGLGNLKKLIEK
ncbi:MAG: SRPBCC family protein [Chitinophagaceae bacterium]